MTTTPATGAAAGSRVNAQPPLKIPPALDKLLGEILPTAIPLVSEEVHDAIKQRAAEFAQQNPGKSPWEVFGESIAKQLKNKEIEQKWFDRLHLTEFFAKISNFSRRLMDLVKNDHNLSSLRVAAQKFDPKAIEDALEKGIPVTAATVWTQLFHAEPTGAIEGLVRTGQVDVANGDSAVNGDILHVISQIGPRDLADKSPNELFHTNPNLLAKIPTERKSAVVAGVNTLARVQTFSPSPMAMRAFINNGLTTALAVTRTPLPALKTIMPAEDATRAKAFAKQVVIKHQNFLTQLVQHVNGTGLAGIDDEGDRHTRKLGVYQQFFDRGHSPDLEDLFGPSDQPSMDDSMTVYSPASYFVDLLLYLRDNNLDPHMLTPDTSLAGQAPPIKRTVLEKLFMRRPDLGNIELSAENSNTTMPYVDLVNEVLESFVANFPSYMADMKRPRQAIIEAYNVGSQDSDELLSQPQNVKMDAYRRVAAAVYPPTLPYHQPLDAQRVFLKFLGVTRAELVQTFRPKPLPLSPKALSATKLTPADAWAAVVDCQRRALNAQYYCEVLNMNQEEFLILTKGVFWELGWFELTKGHPDLSYEDYQRGIGLRSPEQCWGYKSQQDMLSPNGGLQFVKSQLLPRSGLAYTELIAVIQARFVNPLYPSGKDKTILDTLRYSYKYLQELVDPPGPGQYDRLANFLSTHLSVLKSGLTLQSGISNLDSGTRTEEGSRQGPAISDSDMTQWVARNFARVGKITVLESGEGPLFQLVGKYLVAERKSDPLADMLKELPLDGDHMASMTNDGRLILPPDSEYRLAIVAKFTSDGSLIDRNGQTIGHATLNYTVFYDNPIDKNDLNQAFPNLKFTVKDTHWAITGGKLVEVEAAGAAPATSNQYNKLWLLNEAMGGSGNIDDVRLCHLDGSSLSVTQWDRLHRFVRMWRKLGWTVSDTDRALSCLPSKSIAFTQTPSSKLPRSQNPDAQTGNDGDLDEKEYDRLIGFDDFVDPSSGQDDDSVTNPSEPDITYDLIEQLAAVKQILSLTSLTVEQLLTFYSPMTSDGTSSQYYRLFFRRNLRGKDPIFSPDENGDYFTGPPKDLKISLHRVVIMAAFSMKSAELDFLTTPTPDLTQEETQLIVEDVLNMKTLSRIYAYSLLARTLSVKITDLFQIILGFGDPFNNPTDFLTLLQNWSKMRDASFPWQELRYVVDTIPTPQDPLALTPLDSLRVSKTMRDNVLSIQTTYPSNLPDDQITIDYVQKVVTLLFDSATVTAIVGLLGGTTVYSSWAPNILVNKAFPTLVQSCSRKPVRFITPPIPKPSTSLPLNSCTLQVTGILDEQELASLRRVIDDADLRGESSPVAQLRADWLNAVDAISQKPASFFKDTLAGILPSTVVQAEQSPTTRTLLAPDTPPAPPQASNTPAAAPQRPSSPPITKGSATPPMANAKNVSAMGSLTHSLLHNQEASSTGDRRHGKSSSNLTETQSGPTAGSVHRDAQPSTSDESPKADPSERTPFQKAKFFLKYFMPYLQKSLAYNSVLDTVASAAGFKDTEIAKTFLENVISVPSTQPDAASQRASNSDKIATDRSNALQYIITSITDDIDVWQGYLSVPHSQEYVFVLTDEDDQPPDLVLKPLDSARDMNSSVFTDDGATLNLLAFQPSLSPATQPLRQPFQFSQSGDHKVWSTQPFSLSQDKIYALKYSLTLQQKLLWKTSTTNPTSVPAGILTPWWNGYLCPSTTDVYSFFVHDEAQPSSDNTMTLDNRVKRFLPPAQGDLKNIWPAPNDSDEPRLDASTPHSLSLIGISPTDLTWKTATSSRGAIPDSCLLPDIAPARIYAILTKLQKMALTLNHFKLSSPEILYIHTNATGFKTLPQVEIPPPIKGKVLLEPKLFDLDGIRDVSQCVRMSDYTKLRDSLPSNTPKSLIDLFGWATVKEDYNALNAKSAADDELANQISLATLWPQGQVHYILTRVNFATGKAGEFRNERILIRIKQQFDMEKLLDVSLPSLFAWASPLGTTPENFNDYDSVSKNIQKIARSRFELEDWTKAVRPLNNTLRENQRKALVAYLLAQQDFTSQNNIVDADSLFEFFLIDVQMGPLVETSRIVQATASVQLFIQRCMLGLEEELYGISAGTLDRARWQWMQHYRVWEANRKIFLYPENWMVPSLRDNKTDAFKQLESELHQKNLSNDSVNSAIRNYVYNLAAIANMEAIGLFIDTYGEKKLHVFARTRTSPFTYYHNWFLSTGKDSGYWRGWENMQIEIPHVTDPNSKESETGNYIAPTVFNQRLVLFVAELSLRTVPPSLSTMQTEDTTKEGDGKEKRVVKIFDDMKDESPASAQATQVWEMKLSWTEYRNGKWAARQTCPIAYRDDTQRALNSYLFFPCRIFDTTASTSPKSVAVYVAASDNPNRVLFGWSFDGMQISSIDQTKARNVNLKVGQGAAARSFQVLGSQPGVPAALHSLQATNILPLSPTHRVSSSGGTAADVGSGAAEVGGEAAASGDGAAAVVSSSGPPLGGDQVAAKQGQQLATDPLPTPTKLDESTIYLEGLVQYIEDADLFDKTPPPPAVTAEVSKIANAVDDSGIKMKEKAVVNGIPMSETSAVSKTTEKKSADVVTSKVVEKGPSVLVSAWLGSQKPPQLMTLSQRFFHGFIHDLMMNSAQSTDTSGIFNTIGKIGVDAQTGETSAADDDFVEAFGGRPIPDTVVVPVSPPGIKSDPSTKPSPTITLPNGPSSRLVPAANGVDPKPSPPAQHLMSSTASSQIPSGRRELHSPVPSIGRPVMKSLIHSEVITDDTKFKVDFSKLNDAPDSDSQIGDQIIPTFDERRTPYSLYNWELGLHAPMLLIDLLLKAQQFEQARDMCHFVFNPLASGLPKDARRFWNFPPFKTVARTTIESLFLNLEAGKSDIAISSWRDNPNSPHSIARQRPQAYMKWIVATYIKILIAWGDSLFMQNTLETIPQAIQMYVLASHIYGPRGQIVPRRGNYEPQTFNSLSKKFDAFSNAMVQLEEAFPFSNQTPLDIGKLPFDEDDYLPNIFGFAGTLYFGIPDNPDLRGLGAIIDDRLLKIRSSEDINGHFRQLPLLSPPIDPGLLVQAAAQGLSLNSVLQDLQGPLPNCKLQFLLSKAFELASETKSLGQSLISLREKKDAEQLSVIRQRQELTMQNALMKPKLLALDEAKNALDVLQYNRAAAVNRLTHYFKLVGNDLSGIPAIDQEYQELDAKIQAPIASGGFALSLYEQEQVNKTGEAQSLMWTINAVTTAISILSMLPNINFNASPLGVGGTTVFGAANAEDAAAYTAKGMGVYTEALQNQAGMAGTMGGHQRAYQERILQANTAGYEISGIDKQITGAKIRIEVASKDIEIQQQQIDNAQEISDFLRDKYSSVELYSWMDGQTKSLYYQTYQEAYKLAKRVEKAFKYERPKSASTTYIQAGYWDSSRDGLLAGENLYLALKQLETAYLDERGFDYEITKSISLRMLDPVKLITLRESGSCDFALDEILFDMDFPGHYLRRIKSVSLTIPCVVGPYTSVNATLDLTSSEYRITSALDSKPYFKDLSSGSNQDSRFSSVTAPITSIAVSSAQNDTGVFQLDFSDNSTRYLPFEGAGVISQWRLTLPKVRQFDYNTIYDVIMQVKYTSLDGGDALKQAASDAVTKYFARADEYAQTVGLIALFDITNEFASAWALATAKPAKQSALAATGASPGTGAGSGSGTGAGPIPSAPTNPPAAVIPMGDLSTRLPFFTRSRTITVDKIHVFVAQTFSDDSDKPVVYLSDGTGDEVDVKSPGGPMAQGSTMAHYVSDEVGKEWVRGDKWRLQIGKRGSLDASRCLMVVEYKSG